MKPPVIDDSRPDHLQHRPACFWLTLLWITAIIFWLVSYEGRDVTGYGATKHWDVIVAGVALVTVTYAALLFVAVRFWARARVMLLILSLIACGFLIPAVVLMGLLGAWAYNLWSYVFAALGVFVLLRFAMACR